jgi:hypothetical protein
MQHIHHSNCIMLYCNCYNIVIILKNFEDLNFFCSTLSEFANFDKCHNLSKRNVKLILKILSVVFNSFVCKFFWHSWAFNNGPLVRKKAQFTHELIK